jgi:thiol-disulfide isomerase/thioredoxin
MIKVKLLLLLSLFWLQSMAQAIPESPWRSGDKLPDFEFSNLINHKTGSAKLSDFKGKVVILDFWSTWCTGCLAKFSLSDSLQKEFGKDLQIVLVNCKDTKDTREKVLNVFKRFDVPAGNFSLVSAVYDTVLNKAFPHRLLPHYVWIDRDGALRSITSSDELTRASVIAMLQSSRAPLVQKNDIDLEKPLFTTSLLPVNNVEEFTIFLKGSIPGLGGGRNERIINGSSRGYVFRNYDLLTLFQVPANAMIPDYQRDRLIIESSNTDKLIYSNQQESKKDWLTDNLYTYEKIVPKDQIGDLYNRMLSDLIANSPFTAQVETRVQQVWILGKKGDLGALKNKGEKYLNTLGLAKEPALHNTTLFALCSYLRKISGSVPIIDQTDFLEFIDIDFPQNFTNMEDMSHFLASKGLLLFRKSVPLSYFVIRDKH